MRSWKLCTYVLLPWTHITYSLKQVMYVLLPWTHITYTLKLDRQVMYVPLPWTHTCITYALKVDGQVMYVLLPWTHITYTLKLDGLWAVVLCGMEASHCHDLICDYEINVGLLWVCVYWNLLQINPVCSLWAGIELWYKRTGMYKLIREKFVLRTFAAVWYTPELTNICECSNGANCQVGESGSSGWWDKQKPYSWPAQLVILLLFCSAVIRPCCYPQSPSQLQRISLAFKFSVLRTELRFA